MQHELQVVVDITLQHTRSHVLESHLSLPTHSTLLRYEQNKLHMKISSRAVLFGLKALYDNRFCSNFDGR
jgi:hypothetical protein